MGQFILGAWAAPNYAFLWCGRAMLLQPRIRPSWICHGPKEFGHVCSASLQMVDIAVLSQSIKMCLRDSGDSLQLA